MLRLSVPLRQALARLTLPVLATAAFCLMLLAKADALLADRVRAAVGDSIAPLYALVDVPAHAIRATLANVGRIGTVLADNQELRDQNQRLRKWQAIALALDAENAALKAQLHWIPDNPPRFVTAHVVADTGGIYARSVLVAVGPNHFVASGQIVLDGSGLVGRVTETGRSTARILLITDLNSRVPVWLTQSHAHAILAGDNSAHPRLMFLPQGVTPRAGERVVTSNDGGIFPSGIPVGTVRLRPKGGADIIPDAALDRLDIVRIVNYRLTDLVPPRAPTARQVAAPPAPPMPADWHVAPDRAAANQRAYRAALAAHARLAAAPPTTATPATATPATAALRPPPKPAP